ncbi:hypothetical protein KCV87_14655 [Actinosynnema pretiosum subsp. pretiosum]|uniref:NACHT domain-containing protein n=1 Tax=Actinosynnema pretiosum subsp. pretiosum TaxID=103721 RepID=A0AA45LC50_9PSEU|nr:hypothetical protein KCV87_14655 [Actinosynnema pretiosum subsp. pretiosum]
MAVVLGLWLVPQAKLGEVDPVSAVIALLALAAGLWSGRQAVRLARMTPVPVTEMAARLADEVRLREGRARTQLLGAKNRTIDVDFAFRPAPAHPAQRARAKGQLTQVVDYYRALQPQRLVITGAPGAGKTVLALELLLGLLETRGPEHPVPVRIPATIWDASHPLGEWLVQHLVTTHQQDVRTAQALVKAGLILPVIDGLDEVDAEDAPGHVSRAADVVRALNAYQHGRHAAPLVLTCRTGHYQALTDADVWAYDGALVTINAVDSAKAQEFIQSRVDNPVRWQTVLSTIDNHPGGPLAVGLSTPWRLSLATTVYEQRNPDNSYIRNPVDLIRIADIGHRAVREHLLTHFISAAAAHTAQSDKQASYAADQAHRWLAVLAGYLHHSATTGRVLGGVTLSSTDLVLHQLWPLGGANRVRGAIGAAIVLVWIVATPILLIQARTGFSLSLILVFGVGALLVSSAVYTAWYEVWPEAARVDIRQLRTQKGRRSLARNLVKGLGVGTVMGFVITFGLPVGSVVSFPIGLPLGLAVGLTLGLLGGLLDGAASLRTHAALVTWEPQQIVKRDLVSCLLVGLVFLILFVPVFVLALELTVGLTVGLAIGITFVLTGPFPFGGVGVRYMALLLCTRGWFGTPALPWRLGRFLRWCYQAGLIRQAGMGYQFRHRELQDHLAHHPQSVQVSD